MSEPSPCIEAGGGSRAGESQTARNVVDGLVDVGVLQPSGGRFRRAEVYQASALLQMMDRLVPGIQPTAPPAPRPQE